jgi:hypothetical protein
MQRFSKPRQLRRHPLPSCLTLYADRRRDFVPVHFGADVHSTELLTVPSQPHFGMSHCLHRARRDHTRIRRRRFDLRWNVSTRTNWPRDLCPTVAVSIGPHKRLHIGNARCCDWRYAVGPPVIGGIRARAAAGGFRLRSNVFGRMYSRLPIRALFTTRRVAHRLRHRQCSTIWRNHICFCVLLPRDRY